MIDKFGRVMVYVENPRAVANFWIEKVGFREIEVGNSETGIISVEIAPYERSDTNIVLFDKEFVAKHSPMVNLGSPSILFSTFDINNFHRELVENGVQCGEIMQFGGMTTFNFPDIEGNYFAVREIKGD
ncbi:MAG: Glyoxalase-like domain containing protein [Bacillales bacterium]|jgi:lactoylglutathione lyase|nr:Glyoxalase-like domain containing protein [Bacillales bacterium]